MCRLLAITVTPTLKIRADMEGCAMILTDMGLHSEQLML